MKRALLPVLLSLPLIHLVAACSAEDAPPVVGTAGVGGGSPTGAMGGSAGTGTTTAGTGNSTSGAAGTGSGMAGTSSTAGSGGAGVSGSSSGGSGGSSGGSGGASGGSGGSGGAPPAAVSVGKLDGMLVMTPCKDSQTDDCDGDGWIYEGMTHACTPDGNLDTDSVPGKLEFAVTGEAGKRYIAKMHFYGVMEPKNYGSNATREAGTTRPNVNSNPSTPPPFATMPPGMNYRTSDYNTYEVHTYDDKGVHLQQHFINSDHNMEGHYTFAISYPHDIEIVGGGKVKVRIFDDNCRMIKNCGNGGNVSECTSKARSIDVSGASPAPMGLMQPGLGNSAEQSGQWFFIDVKEIVPKP